MKQNIPTYKTLVNIFLGTLLSVIYVNQQALIYQLGLNVKENMEVCSKLVDHNRILVYNVLSLKSPHNLEKRLLAKNVELFRPRKWQVVQLNYSNHKFVNKVLSRRRLFANQFFKGGIVNATPSKIGYID